MCQTFTARVDNQLWSSPVIQQEATEVQVTLVAQGLRGMNEYRIAFPAHSRAAAFCSSETTVQQLGHLTSKPPEKIRIGCQVGRFTAQSCRKMQRSLPYRVSAGVCCATPKEGQARSN